MKGNHQLIDNFRYIVFLKIDLKEFWKHLALGFNSIFNKIKKDGLNVMTILLFLDQKYISVSDVLRGLFASSLKKEEKPLQIQILTTD